jgi:hypothetical protein
MHGAITKPVVVSTVLTTGYAGNLAKGQLAFVKNKAAKGFGAEVVSDFAGMTAKDLISIRVGEVTTPGNLRIKEIASKSTGFFPIGSIVDIKAYAPSNVELKVDYLEVGYDGINDATALFIPEGKSAVMDIAVYGEVASLFFGREEYLIQKRAYRAVGETMQAVIERLVKEINDDKIPVANGFASTEDNISKFLEVGVINSETEAVTGIDSVFSTITVVDEGDSNDLADIQAQYPTYNVVRTARLDGISTYTILHLASASLANYSKVTVKLNAKGCADCLAGYTEIDGGFVYHISLEDDGVDSTATVQALPGAVALSAIKFGNKDGKGTYSVVLTDPLTSAEIATFLTSNPTAEILLRGETVDVCSDTDTVTYVWANGETCTSILKDYTLILKDTECGASRLTELQAAYPDLTIIEGGYTGTSRISATLTGASGNASLTIGGVTYTTAFTTDLATTAAAFVTAHAAAILSATGAAVTSVGAVITIVDQTLSFPTVVAVVGGLTETLSAITADSAAQVGGCKRVYSTKVTTNIVCDECSDIFLQPFYGVAPEPFEEIYWQSVNSVPSETAKMGFFIKGKPFYLYPEAIEEDFIPFMETSLKIRSASFGWREDDILNYTGSNYDVDAEFARVEKLQFAQDVSNLSQNYFGAERMGNKFFTNKDYYSKNLFTRASLSQERQLKYHQRILQFHVIYRDQLLSQGGFSRSDVTHDFMILVQEGKHQNLQLILNKLAARVGLPSVDPSAI